MNLPLTPAKAFRLISGIAILIIATLALNAYYTHVKPLLPEIEQSR
jgi:hypothetical protein